MAMTSCETNREAVRTHRQERVDHLRFGQGLPVFVQRKGEHNLCQVNVLALRFIATGRDSLRDANVLSTRDLAVGSRDCDKVAVHSARDRERVRTAVVDGQACELLHE